MKEVEESCKPYGGIERNRFSVQSQAKICIPGDVLLRYELERKHFERPAYRQTEFTTFLKELKLRLRTIMEQHLEEKQLPNLVDGYPKCVEEEEQGYLECHLLAIPTASLVRPSSLYIPPVKQPRKRNRGAEPTLKQGGEPVINAQLRHNNAVKAQQAAEDSSPSLDNRTDENGIGRGDDCNNPEALQSILSTGEVETVLEKARDMDELVDWYRQKGQPGRDPVRLSVVVHRRPMFVKGMYTKSRRDVSQTPFFVPHDDRKGMKKLGVTSVEEQITGPLATACGGISTTNNIGLTGGMVYGYVKFHGSGREDMNVRMLLPPQPRPTNVGGRPFVCEVVDALELPTPQVLQSFVQTINQTPVAATDERNYYGDNEMGVGVSGCLDFTPQSSYSTLQSDTEDKVKYYGCLCWSKEPIVSDEALQSRLGDALCPIQLQQRTPMRVVHRRVNTVRERAVLSLRATRIDAHHFRLNMSTEAGTYVKEFVHGDLGRTCPSVGTLLGCRVDILELDCEGIKL